jgi:hypothetical protein
MGMPGVYPSELLDAARRQELAASAREFVCPDFPLDTHCAKPHRLEERRLSSSGGRYPAEQKGLAHGVLIFVVGHGPRFSE